MERIDVVRPGGESDSLLRIEVEVSVDRERRRCDNQEVRRGKREDAFEEGARRGISREERQDEVSQHRRVRNRRNTRHCENCFCVRGKQKGVSDARVTDRPDAKSIAGDNEPIQTRVEHAERKIPVEVFNESVTEFAVGRDDQLRVRGIGSHERITIQRAEQFVAVVEAAVEDAGRTVGGM